MKRLLLALLLPALAACPTDDVADAPRACDQETRADEYSDDMRVLGTDGSLAVSLVSDPAPPDFGDNAWTLTLKDAADGDALLDGCTGTLTSLMPDHGHGSNSPELAATGTSGEYSLEIDFIMAGYWELTLEADCAGTTDTIEFKFCIEG